MNLENLEQQLHEIADKIIKEKIAQVIEPENEIQKSICDTITIISAHITADIILEYEKLKAND